MFNPIHQHLMFKLKSLEPLTLDLEAKRFLLDIVEAIQMMPVTQPQAVMVTDSGNEGLTGSINLATSHIAFHNWTNNGLLMLDVYSCCSFDMDVVLKVVDKYWKIDKSELYVQEVDRNDNNMYMRYIV